MWERGGLLNILPEWTAARGVPPRAHYPCNASTQATASVSLRAPMDLTPANAFLQPMRTGRWRRFQLFVLLYCPRPHNGNFLAS